MSAGVFIDAVGGRVQIEVVHENWYQDKAGLPRKRGMVVADGHALWRVASPGPSIRSLSSGSYILALYLGISR